MAIRGFSLMILVRYSLHTFIRPFEINLSPCGPILENAAALSGSSVSNQNFLIDQETYLARSIIEK